MRNTLGRLEGWCGETVVTQIATVVAAAAALGWLLLVARVRPSDSRAILDPSQAALLAPGLAVVLLSYLAVMVLIGSLSWVAALVLAAAAFFVTYLQVSMMQRLRREHSITLRQWLHLFLGKGA